MLHSGSSNPTSLIKSEFRMLFFCGGSKHAEPEKNRWGRDEVRFFMILTQACFPRSNIKPKLNSGGVTSLTKLKTTCYCK